LEIDLREQRLARGGSTISQQLVKNAFLTQRRSVDRKNRKPCWRGGSRPAREAAILERYSWNIVELGPHAVSRRARRRGLVDVGAKVTRPRTAAGAASGLASTSEPSIRSAAPTAEHVRARERTRDALKLALEDLPLRERASSRHASTASWILRSTLRRWVRTRSSPAAG